MTTGAAVVDDPKKALEDLKKEVEARDAKIKELESKTTDRDVIKAIESARSEEKQKLYGRMKEMEEKLEKSKGLEEKFKAAQEKLEKLKTDDSNDDKTSEQAAEMEKKLAELSAQMTTQQEVFKQAFREQQLEAYRERRLREAGSDLIPDLVGGATEAEIDLSITKAKQSYEAIQKQVEEKLKKQLSGNPAPPALNPGSSTSPAPLTSAQEEASRLANSSVGLKGYAKNRDEIFTKLGLKPPQVRVPVSRMTVGT